MEEKELLATDRKKLLVLVIYDITVAKRRQKMIKCLEKYTVRVQRSCFEGMLTLAQYKELESEAQRYINEETDSLRIYVLQDHTRVKAWGKCEEHGAGMVDDVFIY